MIALLYSVGAHGIMTLNDFKSIEGDRRMGIDSLPVLLGAGAPRAFACLVMAVPQVAVVGLLLAWRPPFHAAAVGRVAARAIGSDGRICCAARAERGTLVQRHRRHAVTSSACWSARLRCARDPGGLRMSSALLSWFGIVGLGLVQTALGASSCSPLRR